MQIYVCVTERRTYTFKSFGMRIRTGKKFVITTTLDNKCYLNITLKNLLGLYVSSESNVQVDR